MTHLAFHITRIGLLFLVGYLLLPPVVAAQCGQRDVSGRWSVLLGEYKTAERLDIKQAGTEISGTADTNNQIDLGFEDRVEVKGHVTGDKIRFEIVRTDSKKLGEVTVSESFDGVFASDGTITGKANIFALAGRVSVDWTSDRPMTCLHKTVGSLGVKHTDTTAQAGPWITAAPNNMILPFGQTAGVTYLTWDAGKDHPYAEVWVKVNDQPETKVLEQGNGTLPASIVAGNTYVYILTDAGTTLATVTVRFGR
jgi:hypothetical protein